MPRRKQIEMTEAELTRFLSDSQTIMLVSIGRDGFPHPMPMWFAADENHNVTMSTFAKSQKIRNIERDKRVSLLLESGDRYEDLKGVVIYGQAELIDDNETTAAVMGQVAIHRGDLSRDQLETALPSLRKRAEKRVTIQVNSQRIVSWDHAKLKGAY